MAGSKNNPLLREARKQLAQERVCEYCGSKGTHVVRIQTRGAFKWACSINHSPTCTRFK